MINLMDLQGTWQFALDPLKQGMPDTFNDTITLPNTTSYAKKGPLNEEVKINCLTDEYAFSGWAWFRREVEIPTSAVHERIFLFLERTRITKLWVDDTLIGSQNSLCTPHIYDLSETLTSGKHILTICVDNTNYPTGGGHLTSEDTQTNWNGITGKIQLRFFSQHYLKDLMIFPDAKARSITIKGQLENAFPCTLHIEAESFNSDTIHHAAPMRYTLNEESFSITYPLGEDALLWDEHSPNLYKLTLKCLENETCFDTHELTFGLRDFKGVHDKFMINGRPTFLRGKHDGLIFPRTGFAPTDLDSWLKVLSTAKSYGINHYRFHTCCPPEAAFEAADRLGIYMQPELPFWGTITEEGDENHNQAQQDYLIEEGFNMLRTFGHHPSFAMMSLGNELWGSQRVLNDILGKYKAFDPRHLYTQGSNNFQFSPCILENDDFFSGVRFSRDRLFRGSYAMCDAPQGILQTMAPSTSYNYDEAIYPSEIMNYQKAHAQDTTTNSANSDKPADDQTIEIQYGTGVKTVSLSEINDALISDIPVVSHEIGQYETFPNFEEIKKYTGSIKAKNFEVFRDRLKEKGLLDLAPDYFKASGELAVACYKEEIETALRTKHLAGFQLLDLQDFSGQGTALVGVLDAFMESKGLISAEGWRSFCSDTVLLGDFGGYIYEAGHSFTSQIHLAYYGKTHTSVANSQNAAPNALQNAKVHWQLRTHTSILAEGTLPVPDNAYGLINIGEVNVTLPEVTTPTALTFTLSLLSNTATDITTATSKATDISTAQKPNTSVQKLDASAQKTDTSSTTTNSYELMLYPHLDFTLNNVIHDNGENLHITHNFVEAADKLQQGERVLLLPEKLSAAIEGTYCTDFWCYPMFRSISESVNKPIPIGTMGLLIQNEHPAFTKFPVAMHTTPCWYNLVSHSECQILDDLPQTIRPIVQMIDNFERNHNLGILYEAKVGEGKLLVCTSRLEEIWSHIEVRHFAKSIIDYALSDSFNPQLTLSLETLQSQLS